MQPRQGSEYMMRWMFCVVTIYWFTLWWVESCHGYSWTDLKLPDEHIPYFFTNNPEIKEKCQQDEACPYKEALSQVKCWGYEKNCPKDQRLSNPICPESSAWTKTKEDQIDNFWKGADFGYVLERRKEMTVFCKPESENDSLLECAKYARYCHAKNIYFDFRKRKIGEGTNRFREDFLLEGEIGGHCTLKQSALKAEGEHKSALQSWFAEVEHYTSLPFQPINKDNCDIIIDKPVMFMKLDAGVNMYHHFCDFINFYTSQHINNSFSLDLQMINWDTSGHNYGDLFHETYQAFTNLPIKLLRDFEGKRSVNMYGDLFHETYRAFTNLPIKQLKEFEGKRVCVKEAVFPLLPRMRWGMFYNMPLIPGCYNSSLYEAFSAHLVHRLKIPQEGPIPGKVRVTLLDRKSQYRNILNQDELYSALKTVGEYDVRLVAYKFREMPYLEQVKISHNSDIFIGMHGAGLTHMLFQPDWGAVIELYNCGDKGCYYDLARLRGVKYFTWENEDKVEQEDEGHHPTLGAHQKFTNYKFDVKEFMNLVAKAAAHVRSHPKYQALTNTWSDHKKDEL